MKPNINICLWGLRRTLGSRRAVWAAEKTSVKQIYLWTMNTLWFKIQIQYSFDTNSDTPQTSASAGIFDFKHCSQQRARSEKVSFWHWWVKIKRKKSLPLNCCVSSACDFHRSCYSPSWCADFTPTCFISFCQSQWFPALTGEASDTQRAPGVKTGFLHLDWGVTGQIAIWSRAVTFT